MRDGVELVADHYRPLTSQPRRDTSGSRPLRPGLSGVGAVRQRLRRARLPRRRAERSRHVRLRRRLRVLSCNEVADGADTAAWLRDQPWFTGSFATVGASYLGFTQWALLTDPPPEMAAAVITVGPHDFSGPRWGTGSFGLNDFLGWSDGVAHQEDPGPHPDRRADGSGQDGWWRARQRVYRSARRAARLLGEGAPWFESWLEHPEHDDPFWAPTQLHARAGTDARSRCCCSPAGRTCSSSRRWSSTRSCAGGTCRRR